MSLPEGRAVPKRRGGEKRKTRMYNDATETGPPASFLLEDTLSFSGLLLPTDVE